MKLERTSPKDHGAVDVLFLSRDHRHFIDIETFI